MHTCAIWSDFFVFEDNFSRHESKTSKKKWKNLQKRTGKFLDLVCTRDFFFFLLVQEWTSIQQVRYLTFWRLLIFYLLSLVTTASSNKCGKGETSFADAQPSLRIFSLASGHHLD